MEHVPGSPSRSPLTSPASPRRFYSCLGFETRRRVAVLYGSLGSSHSGCLITVTDGGPHVATLLSCPFLPCPVLVHLCNLTAVWSHILGDFAPSHPLPTLNWCTELDMTAVYRGGVFFIRQSHWLRARLCKWFKGFWLQTTAFWCHSDPKERWKHSVHTNTKRWYLCILGMWNDSLFQ